MKDLFEIINHEGHNANDFDGKEEFYASLHLAEERKAELEEMLPYHKFTIRPVQVIQGDLVVITQDHSDGISTELLEVQGDVDTKDIERYMIEEFNHEPGRMDEWLSWDIINPVPDENWRKVAEDAKKFAGFFECNCGHKWIRLWPTTENDCDCPECSNEGVETKIWLELNQVEISSDESETELDITYICPKCNTEWEERWTCACDSECPNCGLRNIEATSWKDANEPEQKTKAYEFTFVKVGRGESEGEALTDVVDSFCKDPGTPTKIEVIE